METINGLYKAECIRTTVFHAGLLLMPACSGAIEVVRHSSSRDGTARHGTW